MDINEVRRLREWYEAVLDDADLARAAYHRAVRELHASGVPLRDLAEQLGMSHQRVHQIVGDTTPSAKKRKRRVAGAVGAAAIIAVVLAGAILSRLPSSDDAPSARPSTMAVDVLTEGQSWRFDYPNHGVSVAGPSPEILLPAGTRISFYLRSADVIHSMWVPRLWGKQDIVPGRTNSFVLDNGTPGTYTGRDAEFAGLTHMLPEFHVRIVPFAEFERWVADVRPQPSQ